MCLGLSSATALNSTQSNFFAKNTAPKVDNNLLKKEEEKSPTTNPFDYSQEQINQAMAAYSAPSQPEAAGTMAYSGSGAEGAGTMAYSGSSNTATSSAVTATSSTSFSA